MALKGGDRARYIGRDYYGDLAPGTEGIIRSVGPGIFEPDIYVTFVVGDKKYVAYDWRFEKIEEEEDGSIKM